MNEYERNHSRNYYYGVSTPMRMCEDDRDHFGMYHGRDAYMPINENDLWDREYVFLRELTYAIQAMTRYSRYDITNDYFRRNPREYYVNRFELLSFTEKKLLNLCEAIKKLIDFKVKLETGWPPL